MDFLKGLVQSAQSGLEKAKTAVVGAPTPSAAPASVGDAYSAPPVGARRKRRGGKKTKRVKAGRRTRRR